MRSRYMLGACYLGLIMAGCEATIETGLPESQANLIVVALDSKGITGRKEREEGGEEPSFRVTVPQDEAARALSVLRNAGLPQKADPGFEEVFAKGGLVPTNTEERARYVSALSGELARSIESIDGVLDARVHIALPEPRDFALDTPLPRPRASVMIKYRRGAIPYQVASIQSLIAGAVQGMISEDVAVIGVPGPAAPRIESGLVRVGPIAVSRGSAVALKATLGVALALDVVLALSLVLVLLQRRRRSAEWSEPTDSAMGGAA